MWNRFIDFIAVYITLIGLVSLSLVLLVMHVGNAPFSAQFLCVVALIDNLIIHFAINNYSVFTFTMVIIPFGLTRDLMVLAISSTMISSITSKSLITKFAHIFFMLYISLVEQHSSYRLKPFFLYKCVCFIYKLFKVPIKFA